MKAIKRNPLNIGLILLYILPPVGIAMFLFLGMKEMYKTIQHKLKIPYNLTTFFFVILFISSVGATLKSREPLYILSAVMILCSFGFYLYILHNFRDFKLKTYVWITIGGGLYIFLFGEIHQLMYKMGIRSDWIGYLTGGKLLGYDNHSRLYGSTYNPNYAAFLLLLSMAFLLAKCIDVLQKRDYKRMIAYFAGVGCLIVGTLDTGSRAGFFTMLFLMAVFLYRYNWRVFLITAAAGILNFQHLYRWMPRHVSVDESMSSRITIWKKSIDIFENNPSFGVTPFGFDHEYQSLTGKDVPHPHNIFLAFFSDFGFLSGMLFIAIIIIMSYHMFRFLKYKDRNKQFFNLFLLSMPIIVLTGLFDFPLSSPQIALPTIILLSLWHRYVTTHEKMTRAGKWVPALPPIETDAKPRVNEG